MAEKRVIELEVKTTGSEKVEKSAKTVKQLYAEAKKELQEMALAYGENSQQAIEAAKKAGALKDVIDDTGEAIKNLQGGGAFSAVSTSLGNLAGGFGAVQGAINLVGVESEEVEAAILKLQSVMAISEGLRSIEDLGRSFGALKQIIVQSTIVQNLFTKSTVQQAVATGTATTAQKIMNTVMKANPIGLVITGIVALTAAMYAFSKSTKEATEDYSNFRKNASKQVKVLSEGHDELADKLNHEIELMKARGATDKEVSKQELKNLDTLEKDRKKRLEEALMLRYTLINQLRYAQENQTEKEVEASKKEYETNKETIKNLLELRIDYSRKKELLTIESSKKEINNKVKEKKELKQIEEDFYKGLIDTVKLNEEAYAEAVAEARNINIESALSEEEKEIRAIELKYAKIQELGDLNKDLEEARLNELNDIRSRYAKVEVDANDQKNKDILEAEKQLQQLKYEAVLGGLSLISDLAEVFGKKGTAQAKRAFQIQKGVSIASTTIETYKAAQSAYASQMTIPSPDAPIRASIAAGIAIAAGLGKVAKISSQKFEGGGAGGSGGAGGGGGTTPNQVTTPNFNIVGQNNANSLGLQTKPLQAYVVSGEVTTQQALDRNRLKNATFG